MVQVKQIGQNVGQGVKNYFAAPAKQRKSLRQTMLEKNHIEMATSDIKEMTPDGPVYHVSFKHTDEDRQQSWTEKAFKRDAMIGLSVGSFLSTIITPVLPIALALTGAGFAIGAVSDYVRNDREMKDGVDIKPPKAFNRDAVKNAFLTGFKAKFITMAIGTAAVMAITAGAAGPLPFLEPLASLVKPIADVIAPVFAGAEGLGAITAPLKAMLAFSKELWLLPIGAYATGMVVGGKRGSKVGQEAMAEEYKAAQVKHAAPSQHISVEKEKTMTPIEGIAYASPGIFAGVSGTLGQSVDALSTAAEVGGGAREKEHDVHKEGKFAQMVGGSKARGNNIVKFERQASHAAQVLAEREAALAAQGVKTV